MALHRRCIVNWNEPIGTGMKHLKILIIMLCSLLLAASANAEDGRNLVAGKSASKRFALVIGNGHYQHTATLPKLGNLKWTLESRH